MSVNCKLYDSICDIIRRTARNNVEYCEILWAWGFKDERKENRDLGYWDLGKIRRSTHSQRIGP